jgi:hypothetical protein
MPIDLQVDQALGATAQPVKDADGGLSSLSLSTNEVVIGATAPETPQPAHVQLQVAGDVQIERNGSPKLSLFSHGYGTQQYSIRATNNRDAAGGRLLVFRNESQGRDDMVLDNAGNLKLEHNGSPKLTLYSRGNGTQKYSIRATNNADEAGGRNLVVRNESQGTDVILIDPGGDVSFSGDVTLIGADCAERFSVDGDHGEPGDVMVLCGREHVSLCTEPYDRRVAGVISGAASRRPGLILGGSGDGSSQLVALSGTVFCKVDATLEPVAAGDLLTTSSRPGHAMRASDERRAFGAILGKAIVELREGAALIPILVTLH